MSTIHWIAGRVVRYAIESLRLCVSKPQGFDKAIETLLEKYPHESHVLQSNYLRLQKTVKRMEIDDLLDAIAKAANMQNHLALLADIPTAAERLSFSSRNSIDYVLDRINRNQIITVRQLREHDSTIFRDLERLIEEEWNITIRHICDERENSIVESRVGEETVNNVFIKHETNVLSAYNIATDCFRVSKSPCDGDHCTNFTAEYFTDNQADRKGCILHFVWSGPVRMSAELRPKEMEIDCLYEQSKWRYALVPGTSKHLTFVNVTFVSDQIENEHDFAIINILNNRRKSISVSTGSTCDFSSWRSARSASLSLQQNSSNMGSIPGSGLLRRFRRKRGSTT